jgi:RNA polymerase sigma factor (sigma-70 family)
MSASPGPETMQRLGDDQLISLYRTEHPSERAEEVVRVLLARYQEQIEWWSQLYARTLCPDGHSLHDFRDDVLGRFHEKLLTTLQSDYRIHSFPGLLHTILKNAAIDARVFWDNRRTVRVDAAAMEPKTDDARRDSAGAEMVRRQEDAGRLGQQLHEALQQLATRSNDGLRVATVLRLRYLEGWSHTRIARHLKVKSTKTVQRLLRDGEARLREILASVGVTGIDVFDE